MVGLTAQANAHVFVGNPLPYQWDLDIDRLIMPMNGDPNHQWGQQPFPCKGHHLGNSSMPLVRWRPGDEVTIQ